MGRQLICERCKRIIIGSYTSALGGNYHPGCFVCQECGKPFDGAGFYEKDGRAFCRACYAERFSPKCVACGKPIEGEYVKSSKGPVHKKCFACAGCGAPLGGKGHYEKNGGQYCEPCYGRLFLEKCSICKEPIKGKYIADPWENVYCERHRRELEECFFCSRLVCKPLTGGGVRYDDGRTVCRICYKTAVFSESVGAKIFKTVGNELKKEGIGTLSAPVSIKLADLRNLGTSSGDRSRKTMGNTRKIMSSGPGRFRKCVAEEIRILSGLPESLFGAVAAHEYGHAWFCENGFHDLPTIVEEGLCELFSYCWLRRRLNGWFSGLDKKELKFWMKSMESNTDPIYGRGFQQALKSARIMGVPKLLEYAGKHAAFPR